MVVVLDLCLRVVGDDCLQVSGQLVGLSDLSDALALLLLVLLQRGLDLPDVVDIAVALAQVLDHCQTVLPELTLQLDIQQSQLLFYLMYV